MAARQIVEGYSLEEFMRSIEARYALRYSLVLLAGATADAATGPRSRLWLGA